MGELLCPLAELVKRSFWKFHDDSTARVALDKGNAASKSATPECFDILSIHIQTMQEIISRSTGRQRFPTVLLMAFAGLALVLASLGTYGVISYSTSQRMHEIGIRIAPAARHGWIQ